MPVGYTGDKWNGDVNSMEKQSKARPVTPAPAPAPKPEPKPETYTGRLARAVKGSSAVTIPKD